MTGLLTPAQVAARLDVSANFVKAELRRKNLRGSLLPAGWRVASEDVDTYIEAHMNVAKVRRAS